MALGTVQSGYGKPLYTYSARVEPAFERSYAELLAELTTELELALEGGTDETVSEEDTGEETGKTEAHSERKKEWEELLEMSEVVEAVLHRMLENGLGQREEEPMEAQPKKQEQLPTEDEEEELQLLLEESTRCTWRSEETKEKTGFRIWYTKQGIQCRREEEKKKEWFLPFLTTEEYEKVLAFLKQFPEDFNLVFTANAMFWLDFLDNTLDLSGFAAYARGREKNGAEASEYPGNSEFLQTGAGNWTTYFSPSGQKNKKQYLHKFCLTCETDCNRKKRWKLMS